MGIAADEPRPFEKDWNEHKAFPPAEWDMAEAGGLTLKAYSKAISMETA